MRLTRSVLDQITEHLKSELPLEGWGILAGIRGEVMQLYRMVNAARSEERYACDAEELFRVLSDVRESGMETLCIYHSHPPVGAYFSATDLREAWIESWNAATYPGVIYLVVGFRGQGEPQEWRAFRVEEAQAVEELVEIVD